MQPQDGLLKQNSHRALPYGCFGRSGGTAEQSSDELRRASSAPSRSNKAKARRFLAACTQVSPATKIKKGSRRMPTALFGRSGGTRTRGLQYPKLARYHLRYTSWVANTRLWYYSTLHDVCQGLFPLKSGEKAGFCPFFFKCARLRHRQRGAPPR